MKISLVTPCYNSAATIDETIRSVLDQEGVDFEYAVMDGGSTDGTVDIIRKYEPRLAWWASERDRGQVDALNKSFPRLTGDVIGFLNADDALLPGALRAVHDAFAARPDADLVQGGIEWIDFEGRPLGSHCGDIGSLGDILDIYRVWWGGRQWVQPEVFYRRALQERVGAFDERYDLAFDFDFWVRCFRAGARVARIGTPLVRFRRHDGQKSVAYEKANDQVRAVLRAHLDDRPEISLWTAFGLRARLSYDLYQSGRPALGSSRRSFASALLRHPEWLLCPGVRARIFGSLRHRTAPDQP